MIQTLIKRVNLMPKNECALNFQLGSQYRHQVVLKLIVGFFLLSGLSGCATIKLGTDYNDPLQEQTLEKVPGATSKVLMIQVEGVISDLSSKGLLSSGPSLLDRVMMQLAKAEKDTDIKTILLKLNTPGGGVTSSDILYHELMAFKQRTGIKIYVQMMDVAASGGYYLAMAADHIQAHPTTITGSVGVISISPNLSGLMKKVGVEVAVYKTGELKDSGSPFRKVSQQDQAVFQTLIDGMAKKFHLLVQTQRGLSDEAMTEVKTAKIFSGEEALQKGLIDSLGYLSDAKQSACALSGQKACNLMTYRFEKNQNATLYSPSASQSTAPPSMNLIQSNLLNPALNLKPGVYYLLMQ